MSHYIIVEVEDKYCPQCVADEINEVFEVDTALVVDEGGIVENTDLGRDKYVFWVEKF